jgi:threonine dehydrogenase-like Zn-dependent dehydrogenase
MPVEPKNAREARALWYVAPGRAEWRPAGLRKPGPGEARVRMLWSGLSRGTERLVFSGRVPASEYLRMRAPMQEGDFPFPVKFGYCAVGIVELADDPDFAGRRVFCLHPHQTAFVTRLDRLTLLPDGLPPRRAVLAANMETALNALWDSGAGPGDRIVVVGAGVVGLLVAFLAAGLPGAEVTVTDVDASRAGIARSLGADFAPPDALPAESGADVVFHASASAAGLAAALAAGGLEARIVELSWYGEGGVPAPLGGAFHSRRLQLVSSQVGQVSPLHRPRWSHGRRLAKAVGLLNDPRLDALMTDEVDFADLPGRLPALLAPGAPGLGTAIRYPAGES